MRRGKNHAATGQYQYAFCTGGLGILRDLIGNQLPYRWAIAGEHVLGRVARDHGSDLARLLGVAFGKLALLQPRHSQPHARPRDHGQKQYDGHELHRNAVAQPHFWRDSGFLHFQLALQDPVVPVSSTLFANGV